MVRKKVEDSSNQAPHDIENPNNSVATSMRKRLVDLSPLSPYCCIYRVPERLRCVKKKAYTPQVVSIGPLHHGSKDLLYMEEHKQRYLQDFLCRTRVSLEDYVNKIKDQEARLRGCYEETIPFKSDDFVSIILVDATFIIELLLRNCFEELRDKNDWIFKKPWMLQNIAPDMILLENQLPFFILEDLFDPDIVSSNSDNARRPSIIELSYKFFQETVRLQGGEDNLKRIFSSSSKVEHFVDFIRAIHLPVILPSLKSSQTGGALESTLDTPEQHHAGTVFNLEGAKENLDRSTSSSSSKVKHFRDRIRIFLPLKKSKTGMPLESTLKAPCAKKLHQAGVKFQVRSSKNLFDIHFDSDQGILEIPQVEIHDYTELTLRNILAFEQCHCMENYVSDYLSIMDHLVNTPMDVDFLVEDGIVVNTLGDNNKVSTMTNNLCIGVSWNHKNYYFAALSKNLNNYCRKPWNKSKASLRQKYFNTPWAMISVLAAGFLIVLTIIQTVCSIISVIN